MSPGGIPVWNCRAAGQGAERVWLHSAESEPGCDNQAHPPQIWGTGQAFTPSHALPTGSCWHSQPPDIKSLTKGSALGWGENTALLTCWSPQSVNMQVRCLRKPLGKALHWKWGWKDRIYIGLGKGFATNLRLLKSIRSKEQGLSGLFSV